jgi:lipooligosaccharide transport system permease protein
LSPPIARALEREIITNARMWRGLAFSSFVAPILFLLALGVGLGDLVDTNTASLDGLSYLEFVAPGLMVATVVQIAGSESLWPVMAGMKWTRQYHGMTSAPLRPADVFGGFVLFQVLRAALMGAGFIVAAALLGAISSPWAPLAIVASGLTAAAICAPVGAWAATRESDMGFSLVYRLVILPLFLFSGTFFPVSELPGVLQRLVVLSPLWHGVELARAATTGVYEADSLLGHVAALGAFILAGSWWGVRTFTRRLAS